MTGLRRPRWVQRVYAGTVGYFWEPCPECLRMFGGHETDPGAASVYVPSADGWFVVCRTCGPAVRARRRRKETNR